MIPRSGLMDREVFMFDSLDEQMKADDNRSESAKSRYMRWAVGGLGGLIILGALLFGVARFAG